ncbi:MAG: class II aldolase [Ponticaulis sp.]|nr:class II aldolase [Ponticaulis sp.]|tara:strand:- start:35742 stop:36512 length:771 start_codon:yes stop_codon:yes gene_type:complete
MADDLSFGSVKDTVSAEEWEARVNLAALYRLIALHGWDDLIFTHISMRVPGPEHHFLINPYGLLFEEMTASSLVKVDLEGEIVSETPFAINPAGFTIHSAIHAAREDAQCVMHLHTDCGVAVSAQKDGLLPISQHAMIAMHEVAYHDYEGIALNHDERERIVADMGDKSMLILRNHGTLTCGRTAAQTYLRMFYLERACKMQVMAQSGGDLILCGEDVQKVVEGQSNPKGMGILSDKLVWPAVLRRLDRNLPGYDD